MSLSGLVHQLEIILDRVVGTLVRSDRFDNEDELWFAKSAFIYTYIGAAVAFSYGIFYWILQSYRASLSLGLLVCILVGTTPMHLFGKSRLLAKINLASTSFGLAGVVLHMGGVDSSAACWLLGVTPGVTALLFRRAKEIFQLTSLTLALYSLIFMAELYGYQVYRFHYPEGSFLERVYTFIHFSAFCAFIAITLAIFATTQRRLLREVDRRAREMKTILANIRQGIFTITSSDMEVGTEYSSYLEKIVEQGDICGRSAMELVFERSNLNTEQKDMMTHVVMNCVRESSLNFLANEDNLAREIIYTTPAGRQKILLIDWQPIVNEKFDVTEKLLVTLSDMTEFKQMEKQQQNQQREIEIITEITDIDAEKFERFMRNARTFLAENRRICASPLDPDGVRLLFINVHTLKGAARTYRFKHLTAVLHDCEDHYAEVQRGKRIWNQHEALEQLKKVETVFAEYESIAHNKLKRGQPSDKVHIDLESVRENIRLLQKIETCVLDEQVKPVVNHMKETFYRLYYYDIETLFDEIMRPLPALAKDLGKPVPRLDFKAVKAGLSRDACDIIRNAFVHILRNSLDHGIEAPTERQAKNKSLEGIIHINVSMDAMGRLLLVYTDDGRGLQLDRILTQAQHKGLLPPDEKDPETIAAMIFHPGLSTANAVTDISGRGVGMGAVREFLQQVGGQIEVRLLDTKGLIGATPFEFHIRLPRHFYTLHEFEKSVA